MQIKGRHALVTGSAKRVGRAIAEALLERGARLSAHYHHSVDEVTKLAEAAGAKGREVRPFQADLSRTEDIFALVKAAEKHFGPVDILINSASDFYPTPVLDVTPEQWDTLFDLNLKGQFFLAQACGKSMRSRGGVIVNLADVNGTRPMRNFTPYVCTKAALLMMTKNLALEWAPNVRVNAISPGAVLLPENYSEAQKERAIKRSLLGRLGSPEDIASATIFLIENDYVTGFDLKVDGGRELAGY